jgi:hypothetical protein
VSVTDVDDEARYLEGLERAGVQLRSRDELHRYFRPFQGMIRDHSAERWASTSGWHA